MLAQCKMSLQSATLTPSHGNDGLIALDIRLRRDDFLVI